MNKKHSILWLALSTTAFSQHVYAHNTVSDIEKNREERQQALQKQDQDTWDDFMNAVKQQEAKPEKNRKNTGEGGQSKPHHP